MNWILLALTIFLVVFVMGTVFWMMSTLGPLRKKQLMRKQAREEAQHSESDSDSDSGSKRN